MRSTLLLCSMLLILGGCEHKDVLPNAYLRSLSLGIEPLRDGLLLKWTPQYYFEDYGPDNSVLPAQYEIYVSDGTEKELRKVAVIDGTVREYAVRNQPEGKTLYAQVKAIHPQLKTSESNIVTTNTGQLGTAALLFPDNTPAIKYGAWQNSTLLYSDWSEVWAIQSADGNLRTVKNGGSMPVLSPDGRYVAFLGSRNPNTSNTTQLFVETVESGAVQLIDTQPGIFSVEWSTDGRTLAYVALGEKQSNRSVWIRSLAADKSVLLYTPAASPDQLGEGRIDWSPDDTFIVVTQGRTVPSTNRYVTNLVRVPVDGSAPQTLLASDWFDEQPAFSPEGQRLAFISNRSGYWAIWILNLKTDKLRQVTGSQEQFYYINRLDWKNNTQLSYTAHLPLPADISLKIVTLP